jgi:uncharacterized protein YbjT (DUF2867 family)
MKVVVVGGTGTVGSPTVAGLAGRGHEVRVLSRHGGALRTEGHGTDDGRVVGLRGDVTTGAGLAEALDGVDAVVDVSNVLTLDERTATAFFVGATDHLLDAEASAGVRRHVALSIVGVDLVPTGYYRAKVAQEWAVEAGGSVAGVRWNVLRATQFHEFAGQMIARLRRGPVVPVPVMSVQPVSTLDVAAALADAVELGSGLSGRLPDVAGPEVLSLPDMTRAVLDARGDRALIVPLRLPGRTGRAIRRGMLRPASGTPVRIGAIRFDDYVRTVRAGGVTAGTQARPSVDPSEA